MKVAHTSQFQYKLNDLKIVEVQNERDLGIEVTSDVKPSLQCTKAASKAMQVLGIIKRNFGMNDKEDFRLLFNGFVRTHLEYCVQVWSPYLKKDIDCLEKVQRRATKLVRGLRWKSYEERLSLLGILSLEKRRLRGDLNQVFRIVKGFDKVDSCDFFQLDNSSRYELRGHSYKLKVRRCRLSVRQKFFSQRVVNVWNKLTASVVEATSVNTFKKILDEWMDVEL